MLTLHLLQPTLAVSLPLFPTRRSSDLPESAHVAVVIAAVSVPLTAVHTQVPPVQLPTAAVVGSNWQLVAPAATVLKVRLPPGPPVSVTVTPVRSCWPVLATQIL